MNINNKDSQILAVIISKIKKQSKNLLKLSKESNDLITINNLAQAQDLLAKVYGYPSWYALQNTHKNMGEIKSISVENTEYSDVVGNSSLNLSPSTNIKFSEDNGIFYIEDEEKNEVVSYFKVKNIDKSTKDIAQEIKNLNKTLSFNLNMKLHNLSILLSNEVVDVPPITKYSLIETNQTLINENPLLQKLFSLEVDLEEVCKIKSQNKMSLYIRINTQKDFLIAHKEIYQLLLKNTNISGFSFEIVKSIEQDIIEKFKVADSSLSNINEELFSSLVWNGKMDIDLLGRVVKWTYLLNYIQKNKIELNMVLTVGKNPSFSFEFKNKSQDFIDRFLTSVIKTNEFMEEDLIFRDIENTNHTQSLKYPSMLDNNIYNHDVENTYKNMDVTMIMGKPGSGKSVVLNNLILAQSLKENIEDIPKLLIMDVGASYSSYIQILNNIYPSETFKNKVIEINLEKTHFVNVFDTALGYNEYSKKHKSLIVNSLLSLMPTTLENKKRETFSKIFFDILDDSAFKEGFNKLYTINTDESIDDMVKKLKFKVTNNTKWWDIVDLLFSNQYYTQAIKAQRYAVPTVLNLLSLIRMSDDQDYIALAKEINIVIKKYPQFVGVTNIDISDKKIVLCNFDNIFTMEDSKYTNYMGIALLNLSNINFFGILDNYEYIDGSIERKTKYTKYHQEILKNNLEKKILVIDELHRFNQDFENTLLTTVRKSKENKLSVILSSQNLNDAAIYAQFSTEMWIHSSIQKSEYKQNNLEKVFVNDRDEQSMDNFCWRVSKLTNKGIQKNIVKMHISNYFKIAMSSLIIDVEIRKQMLKKYSYIDYLEKIKNYLALKSAKSLHELSFSFKKQNEDAITLILKEIENM